MADLKNASSKRVYFQAENKEKLVVDFDLVGVGADGNPNAIKRSLAYDLEDSEETIKEALQKYLDNYNNELALAETNAQRDQVEAEANQTIDALQGFEISGESATVEKEDK